jgi:hypothetical protein
MRGNSDDLALPLPVSNPMGKRSVVNTLDTLLALDAEGVASLAIEEAVRSASREDCKVVRQV